MEKNIQFSLEFHYEFYDAIDILRKEKDNGK